MFMLVVYRYWSTVFNGRLLVEESSRYPKPLPFMIKFANFQNFLWPSWTGRKSWAPASRSLIEGASAVHGGIKVASGCEPATRSIPS